jgi:hypothetical protein
MYDVYDDNVMIPRDCKVVLPGPGYPGAGKSSSNKPLPGYSVILITVPGYRTRDEVKSQKRKLIEVFVNCEKYYSGIRAVDLIFFPVAAVPSGHCSHIHTEPHAAVTTCHHHIHDVYILRVNIYGRKKTRSLLSRRSRTRAAARFPALLLLKQIRVPHLGKALPFHRLCLFRADPFNSRQR